MNRYIIISSVVAMLSIGARGQDSTGISFQSLVKSTTVNTANTTIGVRLSVLQNSATGPVVYAERQTPMSDQFGMITLEIGAGTAESGVFGEIDWGSGRHFIKSEIDPSGGTNYSISGTFEQLSVPYALYARRAGRVQKSGSVASLNARISDTGDTLFLGTGSTFVIIPDLSRTNQPQFPDGFMHCDTENPTIVKTVTSATNKVWMDRNLGASQVATSSDDSLAFGDLYQWGRFADGHQCRESATTTTLATTASPNGGVAWYGRFIVNDNSPYSWLSSLDGDLWQGVDGNNNPCPEGFRLPTELEWQAEIDSWNFKTLAGAFDSPLKLTAAGSRSHSTGSPIYSTWGLYWTNNGSSAITLLIQGSNARMSSTERATAHSVRCIQDGP